MSKNIIRCDSCKRKHCPICDYEYANINTEDMYLLDSEGFIQRCDLYWCNSHIVLAFICKALMAGFAFVGIHLFSLAITTVCALGVATFYSANKKLEEFKNEYN